MNEDRKASITSLKEWFANYTKMGGEYDQRASTLAEFIIYEAGFIRENERRIELARGDEAVELLKLLPFYPKRSFSNLRSFPKTHAVLWDYILEATVYSWTEWNDLEKFVQSILCPGQISEEESDQLKESLSEFFKKRRDLFLLSKFCVILKQNIANCEEVPLRAVLHGIATGADITDLRRLLK